MEGDSLTQGVKMRFILMIDSKHFLLPGREGNFRDSTHCLAAFNLLTCLLPPRVTFPVHSVSQLGSGLLLITDKSVSGLDLSPGCSSI